MKTLILIRHANAIPAYEARVNTDAERPLSQEGLLKAAQTAQAIKARGLKPEVILTSPLLRARQTAEIVAQTIHAPISQETVLNGYYSDAEVRDFLLEQLQTHDVIAAVGHNPNVSYVTHLLAREVHPFAPGSFAVIDVQPNSTKLIYFGA